METFTVVGTWRGDEPIATGVIAGEHKVHGGDSYDYNECGPSWNLPVKADDVDAAEQAACSWMLNNWREGE